MYSFFHFQFTSFLFAYLCNYCYLTLLFSCIAACCAVSSSWSMYGILATSFDTILKRHAIITISIPIFFHVLAKKSIATLPFYLLFPYFLLYTLFLHLSIVFEKKARGALSLWLLLEILLSRLPALRVFGTIRDFREILRQIRAGIIA